MKNAYIEITNVCNLSCSFCPGHDRARRHMSAEEFGTVLEKLRGKAGTVFLHLMGEPLLHPELEELLRIADGTEFTVKITTNGTLIEKTADILAAAKNLKTVCISLHSFEANDKGDFEKYLTDCLDGAKKLAEAGKFAVLRLWNRGEGGKDSKNEEILSRIESYFDSPRALWVPNHRGERVVSRVFLEWGEKFEWPDEERAEECEPDGEAIPKICHGMLHQIGILSDGTVVPCCLDRNGSIALGNIFESSLSEVLDSPRAKRMRDAMAQRRAVEPLCRTCNFFRARKN